MLNPHDELYKAMLAASQNYSMNKYHEHIFIDHALKAKTALTPKL